MDAIGSWIADRWQDTLIPVAVFLASLMVLHWGRRLLAKWLGRWAQQSPWKVDDVLFRLFRWPSRLWVILVGVFLGLRASQVPADWKVPLGRALWTMFVLSAAYVLSQAASHLMHRYSRSLQLPTQVTAAALAVTNVLVLLVAVLVAMDLWGAPVGPLLLLLAVAAIIAAISLRDVVPNVLAFLHMNATEQIKIGDYIKLENGVEGCVEELRWNAARLRGLDRSTVFVPNSKLVGTTVINYGRPLKTAKEPFRFYSRTHLKELTGLEARTLPGLAAVLRQVPESVVYYHTHHFLEEHHYLTPEPPNDFSSWVTDALGEEALGERLAAVDTFQFPTLGALRDRLVGIIEEHLAKSGNGHQAPEGEEFHFVKSVSFVTPTPYVAHDMRELVEVLRRLPLGSLYFHIFESRMRLGRLSNDFSLWLADSLGEEQMADEIARLDPYNYTLEDLRSLLIRLIEKRIQ